MQVSTATAAPLVPLLRRVLALVVALALLLASGIAVAQPARAAGLKAVFIVGPTHGLTSMNLNHSEALAQTAERAGMDVRRVFHPNATWDNVLANIQGANLVVYMGHGYGWPSPWAFNENGQNGFGLNPVAGGPASQVKYYGAKQIRANVTLASNALVFLNHLCYAAGNGEEGQAIPGWNIAQQRVDNYAAGLLAAGARGVFAYSYQRFDPTLRALLAGNATMADLFRIRGAAAHPSYGYVGWDDRQLASVRTPGTVNWLDPHSKIGFLRAYSGDPTMTAADWASGAAPPEIEPPPDSAPDTSPPTMPMDLVGTALDRRYVQLSWTASTDDRPGVRYRIRRDGVRIADVSEPSYIDRPPAVGSYSYSLRAIDAAGNKSAWSAPVTVGAVKVALPPPDSGPDTTPPTTPAGLAGSALDRR
ncbi:MAG TPA: hypothetical protein VNW68_05075, partial [Candidatus Limnocylindria bacterium]|nr:hypothetical protein [Candidatus Limnocylindria bacterium]